MKWRVQPPTPCRREVNQFTEEKDNTTIESQSLREGQDLLARLQEDAGTVKKIGHYKKYCNWTGEEFTGVKAEEVQLAESKVSQIGKGYLYLASMTTQSDRESWLINSGASYHMTLNKDWFCKYDKFDGGDVLLGDDSPTKIVGRKK
jgi:hypothetical protein